MTFWRSFGMAVTDAQLPAPLLAIIKRTLGEDMHSLKYVTFSLNNHSTPTDQDSFLGIMDVAKQYSLNQVEFNSACRSFIARDSATLPHPIQPVIKKRKTSTFIAKLPYPKPGLVLFRRDSRRKGSCQVIDVGEKVSTIKWMHNGKLTKIATTNLRSHRLFSLARIY